MTSKLSLRLRTMLLFCAVVGVWLAASYLLFYAVLLRLVRTQFDRRLREAASPVVADLLTDQDEQDVRELNLTDEYFELRDRSGRVLVGSKNVEARPLGLEAGLARGGETLYRSLDDPQRGRLRAVLVPFELRGGGRVLVLAMPTRDRDQALATFRRMILWLLPLSVGLTAAVSMWFAGRSLQPIAELTRQAALMTEGLEKTPVGAALPRFPSGQGATGARLGLPLPVANPRDEVGRLATTFNQLFTRIEATLRQWRQFVSDASHELRTPLSVLQGETELLLAERRGVDEYRKALEVMDGELKKLSRIVEGLFTLAMADAGELRLASEPLYLDEVLEETCSLVAARAQQKNIVIDRNWKPDVPYTGDEAFLRQLFLVFLDNAIKYSAPNTRVCVGLERSDGLVRVRFEDQGIGISSEHLPHIFERFYRAAKPEDGEAQSGGLGLAIAEAIARAHGGSIACESQPGKGSTFTVNLPMKSA